MSAWSLVYEGFDPDQEMLREALCTLGNGYFATRGASSEAHADGVHYPGTYLACGYNRLETEIAGRIIENEALVNIPNWLPLTFRIAGGAWFDLKDVEILSYRQELDIGRGLLLRTVRFRDKKGRQTRVSSRRLVHMSNPHLAAIETILSAENWSGEIEIRSALDGKVRNSGVARYKGLSNKHLEPVASAGIDRETIFLKMQTNQSELRIAQAARTQIFKDGKKLALDRSLVEEPDCIAHRFTVDIEEGGEIRIEKVLALYTSRDSAISECGLEARKALSRAGGFDELLETHTLAWGHLWQRFNIDFEHIDPDEGERTGMILHLHLFHLLQTTSMHSMDLDVGVPSRGWHGEAYRGHIFWDELFIFPLLNYGVPEITRALLMYRFRRLDEARTAARNAGYRGAMFPWQSGSNGREETQVIHLNPMSGRWLPDPTHLQRHVNAAIAYNISQYYEVTGDIEFLSFHGAEMILEIARFWASMATYNAKIDRYEIHHIMGPDEYHTAYPNSDELGLSNNAYTNIMAAWVLSRAVDLLHVLPEDRRSELCENLDLQQGELDQWNEISRKMRVVFQENGIISQFEGYEQLEEFDWEKYRRKYGYSMRLDRILEAEGDSPNRYKASKQADILMLFYLFSSEELSALFNRLGYPFEYETIPRNIEYYLARTAHGSTLSFVVHSWVLARSDRVRSWRLFTEALDSDIADIQGGTTPEGIHLGAMAGTVDLIQCGYTGIEPRGNVLRFNPRLPKELKRLRMRIRYRGHTLDLYVTSGRLKVSTIRCAQEPIRVAIKEQIFDVREGETIEGML